MSNINYTIDDLHHMVNLGVRGNMVCDNIYKQMMPDVVDRYFDNLVTKGNPKGINNYADVIRTGAKLVTGTGFNTVEAVQMILKTVLMIKTFGWKEWNGSIGSASFLFFLSLAFTLSFYL